MQQPDASNASPLSDTNSAGTDHVNNIADTKSTSTGSYPNSAADPNNPSNTVVVGKRKSRTKILILIFALTTLLVVAAISVFIILNQSGTPDVTPTPVPIPATPPPTATPQITPTEVVVPTTASIGKQKYILTNCEIEISADAKWIPAQRGELSTCGIFSTMGTAGFTDFADYPGTLIAVVPFTAESPFTPGKTQNYQDYLKNLPTQSSRYNPARDFLYSQKETKIAGFPGIETQIYKAGLGETRQIFYQGFQRQYVIVWGGQTSAEFETEIREIIDSVKQLIVIPEEED